MKLAERIAYVAGLFDGEGNCQIIEVHPKDAYVSFTLALSIRMQSFRCMSEVPKVLVGSLWPDLKGQCWRYGSCARKASEAAEILVPYLLVKQKQCLIALEYQDHINQFRAANVQFRVGTNGSGRHSEEVVSARRRFVAKVQSLNSKPSKSWSRRYDAMTPLKIIHAYCAGIIDAEGSIMIVKCGRNGRYRLPAVAASMTDPAPLYRLANTFGGLVRLEKRRTKRGKPVYSWRVTADNARTACECLSPYLKEKAEQAKLLIQFQKNVRAWHDRVGFATKPIRVQKTRARIAARIFLLNHSSHFSAGAETKPRHSSKARSDSPILQDGKTARVGTVPTLRLTSA